MVYTFAAIQQVAANGHADTVANAYMDMAATGTKHTSQRYNFKMTAALCAAWLVGKPDIIIRKGA